MFKKKYRQLSSVLMITCIFSRADVIFFDAFELDYDYVGLAGRIGSLASWTENIGSAGVISHSANTAAVDGHSLMMLQHGMVARISEGLVQVSRHRYQYPTIYYWDQVPIIMHPYK
ncbi:MAG: hypothetical protein WC340_11245 [Kiritimatiellia bacterium]